MCLLGPFMFAVFEGNNGTTNTSTVRGESRGLFSCSSQPGGKFGGSLLIGHRAGAPFSVCPSIGAPVRSPARFAFIKRAGATRDAGGGVAVGEQPSYRAGWTRSPKDRNESGTDCPRFGGA